MEESVSASNLFKKYPGDVQALDGLNFRARPGVICALIGANGSGKSTLLGVLFGSLLADSGSVKTLELDPAKQSRRLRSQAGFVPQHPALDPEMTGLETLTLFCTLHGITRASRSKRVAELSSSFGLDEVISRRVSSYSGGQQQRLHLALGFVHQPRLLLLDEPTTGLDPEGRAFSWNTMRTARDQGRSVIVVTHDLEEIEKQCDQVALLSRGKLLVEGTPREIVAVHGQFSMTLKLERTPDDPQSLRQKLEVLESVATIELAGNEITVRLKQGSDRARFDPIAEALKESGIEVVSFQKNYPNLSSAYFHLTGEDLLRGAGETGRERRSRGKRGGRR